MALIDDVKKTLRITSSTFDSEIEDLIHSAKADIGIVLQSVSEEDALIKHAIITYCKTNFGSPDEYDRLKKSYDEQKAQIKSCTKYRGDY